MGKKPSKYEIIVKSVNEVISQYDQKMTLRQIYYRLVSKHIIQNNLNQYKSLSHYLVKARENGDVDWRQIEDRARTTHGGDYDGHDNIDDIEEYVQDKVDEFKNSWADIRLTRWKGQDKYIEVWIEKDALSRLALTAVSNLAVRVCPSKGYSSFTYIAKTVQRLRYKRKDIHILYFGDFDPSGLDIERDLYDRLIRYGAPSSLTVTRIALTQEQIGEHELPPFPAKTSDVRYSRFVYETGSDDAVELDALEPPVLSQLIEESVSNLIDWDIWNERLEEEEEIRQMVKDKLDKIEIIWDEDE